MQEGRLIKHQRTARCDKNTQMCWQRRDVTIVDKCLEAMFSLKGEDKAEYIEGFEVFKYLRRFLYFPDNDWPGVLQNIRN